MISKIQKRVKFLVLAFLSVLFISCQGTGEKKMFFSKDDTIKEEVVKEQTFNDIFDSVSNSIPIFYNMYLTVELASLFEETGVAFISQILNPSENLENYLTSYKKALNIGVYAVDLSYVKAFQEFDYAGKYFSAMHKLAESLGIPDDFFYDAAKRFEKNISNKDSLAFIANEVYIITDTYLKENNRENTASLIIVGGWIEAIYLAFNIYKQSDRDMIILEKIADQETSLAQVIKLIDVTENPNDYILGIVEDMSALQDDFNRLAIKYKDPVKAEQLIENIFDKINLIRNNIIK